MGQEISDRLHSYLALLARTLVLPPEDIQSVISSSCSQLEPKYLLIRDARIPGVPGSILTLGMYRRMDPSPNLEEPSWPTPIQLTE